MSTDDQIRDEELQYDINGEAAKISLGKDDKYEYLTGEEILPSNQKQIIGQPNFTYSPLAKTFENQTKAIDSQIEKQIKFKIKNKLKQSKNIFTMMKIVH